MGWRKLADLNLVWWNTGLTPPTTKKVEKKPSWVDFVSKYIDNLYTLNSFHLLGLCEVNESDVIEILAKADHSHLDYFFPPQVNGRVKIDTAVIFDNRILQLKTAENWLDSYGRYETIKTGVVLTFFLPLINEELIVILSHWPSQQSYSEDSAHRGEIATGCRKSIEALREKHKKNDTFVVLMGDYNAEPFSDPMAKNLLATRDRYLAKADYGMLYNPFWRLMGESFPHSPENISDASGGTCFSASDRYRRWASFDQIIFSGVFLRDTAMVLDEAKTAIILDPILLREIENRVFIDHLPVVSTIQLREQYE